MEPASPVYCGVDVGASATKLVLIDDRRKELARVVRLSGVDYAATAATCLAEALEQAGCGGAEPARTVSTGYGRQNVEFRDASLTESAAVSASDARIQPRRSPINSDSRWRLRAAFWRSSTVI